ncbi:hypothetical protein DBR00_02565 [Pseudomonas sp. HMWF032]|uniref:hypothetical protein n=1 Tax=Pseudomonas sp. HMWF032 TaxID=2056866 RepID=UPI000D366499|nr:hypothetical protein [Pseudomonas sp. HMWF032]PTS86458.1 hypothetical protein DBR00_02565 [Pseudomonas sp. HMWF032]PTT81353.1 hypothetical protein DBR41_16965 [Pseudomonas sp. HMWF010]
MFPELPSHWMALQALLRNILGHPVMLAGGALRDLYAGKLALTKDLDFWVDLHPSNRVLLKNVLEDQGWRPAKGCVLDYTDSLLSARGIRAIDWWVTPSGHEVNLIWVQSAHPSDLIASFDFGINQAVFDGDNWFTSEEFVQDHSKKTITLIRVTESVKRLQNRIDRMLLKFPEYRLEFDWESLRQGAAAGR